MSEIPTSVAERFAVSLREAVALVLTEPEVINTLLERHVQQLIDSGALVPRERLQVGAGVELCPAGLEEAARALLAATDGVVLPEPLLDAFKVMEAVLHPIVTVDVGKDAPVDEDDLIGDDDAQPRCAECGIEIDTEQELISQARWHRSLCADDHANEGDRRRAASRTEQEPDA